MSWKIELVPSHYPRSKIMKRSARGAPYFKVRILRGRKVVEVRAVDSLRGAMRVMREVWRMSWDEREE